MIRMDNGIFAREKRLAQFSRDIANRSRFLLKKRYKLEGREEAIKADIEVMTDIANEIAMVPSWRSAFDDEDVTFIEKLLVASRDKKWIIELE